MVSREVTPLGDTLTVCDTSLLKDTIDLPLSSLIVDIEIVILDEKEEAPVTENDGGTEISDNYIGISSSTGYKLDTLS